MWEEIEIVTKAWVLPKPKTEILEKGIPQPKLHHEAVPESDEDKVDNKDNKEIGWSD